MMNQLPYLNWISEQEFCEHIEDENFFVVYGNPAFIKSDSGQGIVCMTIEYYERITDEKLDFSNEM